VAKKGGEEGTEREGATTQMPFPTGAQIYEVSVCVSKCLKREDGSLCWDL